MPSGFGALTEGLYQSIAEGREEQRRREETAAERESKILTLLAESDDPEIRSMAVTGMLEMANPKRKAKGLRGFLGEMEASQTLPRIRQLLQTPVETEVRKPGLPSRGVPVATAMRGPAALPSRPPGAPGSAAMPSQSPVDPRAQGGPALPSVLPANQLARGPQPPPAPGPAFSEQRGTPTVTTRELRPRQVFLPPDERLRRDTIAREQAEIEGRVAGDIAAGFTREQSLAMLRAERERLGRGGRLSGFQRQAVEVPDGRGGMLQTFAVFNPNDGRFYDPDTQEPILDARPVSRETRIGYGVEADRAAQAEFGRPYSQLTQEEKAYVLNVVVPRVAKQVSYARGSGTGTARIETDLNMPISIDDAAQLQQPVGTTKAALAGQVPQTPAQQELRQTMAALTPQLEAIRTQLRAVLPSKDSLGGMLPGAYIGARQVSPEYRVEMAKLRSAVDIAVNNVARILGGQRGAQTEKDAERAYNSLLNLQGALTADTVEAAEARLQETLDAMGRVTAALPPPMTATPPPPPGAPTAATVGTAPPVAPQRNIGDRFQHPTYGWVEVIGINAQGKPRVRRIPPPQ